jgi:HEAT repeat protein
MPETFDFLIEIWSNADWEDRVIALRGLTSLQDVRAVPHIIHVTGALDPSEPDNEEIITEVLASLTQFGCCAALIEAARNPAIKHVGKVLAIEALAALECQDATPVLVELLAGDLREVRRASVRALGEFTEEEAVHVLRDSIEDRDGHIRRAAATALGKLKDQLAFVALLEHLPIERYSDVFEATVKALLMIDEERFCQHLDQLAPVAREIVGRFGSDETTLLQLSRDKESGVRLAALSGLARLSTDASEARLREALQDPDAESRKSAIVSLGTLNRGLGAIQPLLEDEDFWVRQSAATVLGAHEHSATQESEEDIWSFGWSAQP